MSRVTHALLLTAGLGTRLRPLTSVRAKPAIPVAGDPMVCRILRWLAAAGVEEVVLNLHHLPETITRIVGDGSELGVRARYSWEQPAVLGSAGGPRQALDIVGADPFLIVNGDTLTDLDPAPLVEQHAESGALVTLAVVPNVEPLRYSGLRVDDQGRVVGRVARGSSERSYHFIGVQVVSREAFADLPLGHVCNSVGGSYDEWMARRPGSIRVCRAAAAFWDIGTIADYWATNRAFAAQAGVKPSPAPDSGIVDSIVWDDVTIEAGAHVERCIVTDGVRVPAGARYQDMILMRDGDGSTIAAPIGLER